MRSARTLSRVVAGAVAQRAAGLAAARRGPLRAGREREGDAGEVLDDAVVQVGRDPPALDLRGVQRAVQQRLALALAAAQAAGERAREGQVDELQQQQAAEQRGRER